MFLSISSFPKICFYDFCSLKLEIQNKIIEKFEDNDWNISEIIELENNIKSKKQTSIKKIGMIIFVVSILMTYIIIANNRKKVKSNTDEPNKNNPNTDASDQISSDDKKSKKVVPIKLPNGNEQNREQISGDNKEKDEKEVGHQVEPKGNEQNQEQTK